MFALSANPDERQAIASCALAVAADHTTLPPVFVARLLGITEGKAQETEHRAMRWCLREWQRLDDEEDARYLAACKRAEEEARRRGQGMLVR